MNRDGGISLPGGDAEDAIHAEDQREIVHSLELAITQIGMSLQESEQSVASLIDAITAMAGAARRITEAMNPGNAGDRIETDAIRLECRQMDMSMQRAVTAFQFYDLLSQRLLHVRKSLRAVADVMQAPGLRHPAMWQELHATMRSIYSLEQERHMYEALLRGLSAGEACEAPDGSDRHGDVELF